MQIIKDIIRNYHLIGLKELTNDELVTLVKENDFRRLAGKKLLSIDKFIKEHRK